MEDLVLVSKKKTQYHVLGIYLDPRGEPLDIAQAICKWCERCVPVKDMQILKRLTILSMIQYLWELCNNQTFKPCESNMYLAYSHT